MPPTRPFGLTGSRTVLKSKIPAACSARSLPKTTMGNNDYRNPVIAEVMKALGYVERFGTGITRANAALKANNNPQAEFTFEPAHVLVTIRRPV